MNLEGLIAVARGEEKADLVIKNANIINVFSGNIHTSNIAIYQNHIAGIGDYKGKKEIDLKNKFIAPGFIDSHVHIESTMACVSQFAKGVVPKGTTSVVADPHEIANVLGEDGIQYMLDSAENQPMNVFYSLPSCVPATNMETSGANLDAGRLKKFIGNPKILALAEMMNYPGVIYNDQEVLNKIHLAHSYNKPVDGHSPGVSGKGLAAYLSAEIMSDHECTSFEEAREKLESGMFIMIREGTGAKNLEAIFPLINERTYNRMMWCTDDRHPQDILDYGHIDYIIRKAVKMGLDPVMAIQMATINPARYFGIKRLGAIGPGYQADMVIFSDLNNIRTTRVYHKGRLVAENGGMTGNGNEPEESSIPTKIMNIPARNMDFSIKAKTGKINVIGVIENQVVTSRIILDAKIENGLIVSDLSRDILKIAVVERYTGKGGAGIGFVRGMGLKKGAIASTVAHDSHNLIITGVSDNDMKFALETIVSMGGGLVAVADGKVLASLALPIAGLMSDLSILKIRKKLDELVKASHDLGSTLNDPFMTLGFLALPVIPSLKITDKGIVDVEKFEKISLFADQTGS